MRKLRPLLSAAFGALITTALTPAVSAQTVPIGVCVANCADPNAAANSAAAAAAAAAARVAAAAEAVRLEKAAADAFGQGEAALKKGDVKAALKFYRQALQFAPENVVYRRQRAAILRAH